MGMNLCVYYRSRNTGKPLGVPLSPERVKVEKEFLRPVHLTPGSETFVSVNNLGL